MTASLQIFSDLLMQPSHLKVGTTTAPDGHYVSGTGCLGSRSSWRSLSNGEMTLDIYPNSALGGESDMMDAVYHGNSGYGSVFHSCRSRISLPQLITGQHWICRICLRLQRMHTKYLMVRSDRAFWTSSRDLVSKQSDSGRMDSVS